MGVKPAPNPRSTSDSVINPATMSAASSRIKTEARPRSPRASTTRLPRPSMSSKKSTRTFWMPLMPNSKTSARMNRMEGQTKPPKVKLPSLRGTSREPAGTTSETP